MKQADLFAAIDLHDDDAVRRLLAGGLDPDGRSSATPFWRPLGAAIEELEFGGSSDVVRFLVDAGASVNLAYLGESLRPLHAATLSLDLEVVEFLLEHGADPSCRSDSGETPLRMAVQEGQHEMAALLLRYSSAETINETNGPTGDTALGTAAIALDVRMIELLLGAGADPGRPCSDGFIAIDHLPTVLGTHPAEDLRRARQLLGAPR